MIRDAQLKALGQVALDAFAARVEAHLRRHFRETCEQLGPFEVREAVAQGIEAAHGYKIVSERGLCKYLALMFVFGRSFDRDQRWAKKILKQAGTVSEEQIMKQLSREAANRASEGRGIRRLRGEVLP